MPSVARYDEFAEWYEQWIGDAPPLIAAQPGLLPALAGERVLARLRSLARLIGREPVMLMG